MLAAGAKVVVVEANMGNGWQRLGDTGFSAYPKKASSAQAGGPSAQ